MNKTLKNLIICDVCGCAISNNGSMKKARKVMSDTCSVIHKPKPAKWIIRHDVKLD